MFKNILILVFFSVISYSLDAQHMVNWMSMEEAIKQNEIEPKKIVVDIYTDWCGWCKKMEKVTFQEEHISNYLNDNYYAVKFDAEQKQEIIFKGNEYNFVKTSKRGYHELAATFTSGKLSYPTVVFLDENLNVIQAIPGLQDVKTFEMIMRFFGENYYHSVPWQKYIRTYISPYNRGTNSTIETQAVKNH